MNSVLRTVYRSHCPTKSELAHRESALKNLESYLKSNFDSKIKLVLFGSSRNGFGFKGSDMDLCLLFDDNPTEPPEKYNNPIKGNILVFQFRWLKIKRIYADCSI